MVATGSVQKSAFRLGDWRLEIHGPNTARPGSPSRGEWALAVAVSTACAAVVLLTSKNLWFFSDTWAMLATRDLGEFDGWTKPHGGHWFIPSTFMAKATLRLFGAESFYPWYFLPRVVLYGALSLLWWRLLRWRGVDRYLSLAMLAFISWLGVSGWMVTVSYVGTIVVGICALGAALIVDAGSDSPATRLALFVLLTGAVTSSGSGTAVWAAVAIVALGTGRLKSFAWPIGCSGAIYAAWYLLIARHDPSPLTPHAPGIRDIITAPVGMWKLAAHGLAATFGTAQPVGHLLAALGLAALGWVVLRTKVRSFDIVIILAGVIMLALGVLVRGAQGINVAAPNRLYLVAAYILLGVVSPLASSINGRRAMLASVGVVLLSLMQLSTLTTEIGNRERYMTNDRLRIQTAAALIEEGHPHIPWTGPSPQAHHRFIQKLVNQGLPTIIDPESRQFVEQTMKLAEIGNANVGGLPLATSLPVDEAGCAALAGGITEVFEVAGNGVIVVNDAQSATVVVTRTGDSSFTKSIELGTDRYGIAYAGPFGRATMELQGDWDGERTVCGLTAQ